MRPLGEDSKSARYWVGPLVEMDANEIEWKGDRVDASSQHSTVKVDFYQEKSEEKGFWGKLFS